MPFSRFDASILLLRHKGRQPRSLTGFRMRAPARAVALALAPLAGAGDV
jgi:hypothetical protein